MGVTKKCTCICQNSDMNHTADGARQLSASRASNVEQLSVCGASRVKESSSFSGSEVKELSSFSAGEVKELSICGDKQFPVDADNYKKLSVRHTRQSSRKTIQTYDGASNDNYNSSEMNKMNSVIYYGPKDIQQARIVRHRNDRTMKANNRDSEAFFSCDEE
jgi:hypothetical protein